MSHSTEAVGGALGVGQIGWSAGVAVGTFKADRDQNGDWWVWRRLSARTWVTHTRCVDEASALAIAERLSLATVG